jgi:hypothetical protein
VAIAMLKNFHPALFGRILRHGNALLAAGLAAAAAVLYGVMNEAPTVFLANTFGFSLVAASFGLLTCAALSPSCLLNRVRIPGAASLALWSYAVYLVHKPVFMALRPQLVERGIDPAAPLTIVAVMAAGDVRRLAAVPAGRDAVHAAAGAVVSGGAPSRPIPALLTSTSIAPAASTTWRMLAGSLTSRARTRRRLETGSRSVRGVRIVATTFQSPRSRK